MQIIMFKETAMFQHCYSGKSGPLSIFKYPSHPFVYILVQPRIGTGHISFLFFTSLWRSKSVLCHLHCKATCLLRSHKQLGNNVALNANEVISLTSKHQVGDRFTFHVSNKIFKFRKLIKMIISSNFLWRI